MGSDPTELPEDVEQSDAEFIHWLEGVLIPDLYQSGSHEVAKDFERLISIITTEERWLAVKHAGLVKE